MVCVCVCQNTIDWDSIGIKDRQHRPWMAFLRRRFHGSSFSLRPNDWAVHWFTTCDPFPMGFCQSKVVCLAGNTMESKGIYMLHRLLLVEKIQEIHGSFSFSIVWSTFLAIGEIFDSAWEALWIERVYVLINLYDSKSSNESTERPWSCKFWTKRICSQLAPKNMPKIPHWQKATWTVGNFL